MENRDEKEQQRGRMKSSTTNEEETDWLPKTSTAKDEIEDKIMEQEDEGENKP